MGSSGTEGRPECLGSWVGSTRRVGVRETERQMLGLRNGLSTGSTRMRNQGRMEATPRALKKDVMG